MNKQVTKTQSFWENYFHYFLNPSQFSCFLGYFWTIASHFSPKNRVFIPLAFLSFIQKKGDFNEK